MPSLTRIVAGAVGGFVGAFPRDYAVKMARKTRQALERFDRETEPLETDVGPILASGVRRSLGTALNDQRLEPELLRWAAALMRPGETVWDVGANVGLYSIYFAKRGLRVFSFEPDVATYREFARNLIANKLHDEINAVHGALSDRTQLIRLPVISFEPGYTITTNVGLATGGPWEPEIGRQTVVAYAGDDFARLFEARPDHIKIDVDGAEIDVIRGARESLKTCGSVLMEVIGPIADAFDRDIRPIFADAGLQEVPVGKPAAGRNRVFARPDRAAKLSGPI